MPRACPVERHVCALHNTPRKFSRCHGLVPWSVTFARSTTPQENSLDATGLSRGASRLRATQHPPRILSICHGLVPWSVTFARSTTPQENSLDATGLSRGASRLVLSSYQRE